MRISSIPLKGTLGTYAFNQEAQAIQKYLQRNYSFLQRPRDSVIVFNMQIERPRKRQSQRHTSFVSGTRECRIWLVKSAACTIRQMICTHASVKQVKVIFIFKIEASCFAALSLQAFKYVFVCNSSKVGESWFIISKSRVQAKSVELAGTLQYTITASSLSWFIRTF